MLQNVAYFGRRFYTFIPFEIAEEGYKEFEGIAPEEVEELELQMKYISFTLNNLEFGYSQEGKNAAMKILVIPDIHLKPIIFHKATSLMQSGAAERAVCLMDIPDDWNKGYDIDLYKQTFDAAIAFAEKYPETIWVYGNHDLSYVWEMLESGYSSLAAYVVRKKLEELKGILPNGSDMKYIYRMDNVIFCHGGLLDRFVRTHIDHSVYDDINAVIEAINNLGSDEIWSDDSPVWHRPQYSDSALYKADTLLQVVGHTPVEKITRNGNVISCDVFSTYRSGQPIGSQKMMVLNTRTWNYQEF